MDTTRVSRIIVIACLALWGCVGSTQATSQAFHFAVIGDRADEAQEGIYEGILDEVERLRPDFAVTVGDAIQGYTDDTVEISTEWEEYLSLVKRLTMPIHYTPGNHDITTEVMRPFYERYAGRPYYSFDYENSHFIVLDNTPGGGGPAEPLVPEQWDWLVRDLAEHADAAHTFVFCHKPFWYENRFENKPDSLHDLLVRNGVDAVFTGHYHRYFSAELDGIKYTCVGSSGGVSRTPFEHLQYHFLWVTVDDDGIQIAPVDQSSVLPWDYTTADQLRLTNHVEDSCIRVSAPIPVDRDHHIHGRRGSLQIRNLSPTYRLSDTLRWDARPGWTIDPPEQPIDLGPGEETACAFTVNCEVDPFPAPVAKLMHPLTDDVNLSVERSLWVARSADCIRSREPVTIDGELSEPCWSTPTAVLYGPDGSPMITDSVRFYFAYDGDNLYLAAWCRESKMDSLRSNVTERDGAVYGEDCVGYFFCDNSDLDTVYQIYINPRGTVFDQKITFDSTGWYETDRDWNGDYDIATSHGPDYWAVEARIPLSELSAVERTVAPWLVNFRRKQKRLNSSADWQAPIDYDPHTYGYLVFAK